MILKLADPGVYDLTHSMLPSGASILEVGAEYGQNIIPFLNKGYEIAATDISVDLRKRITQAALNSPEFKNDIRAIEWVKKFKMEEGPSADVRTFLQDKHEAYDLIIISLVLHFIPKDERPPIADDIVKALKQNGYLYLKVNHYQNLSLINGELAIPLGDNIYANRERPDEVFHLFKEDEILNFHPYMKLVDNPDLEHPLHYTALFQKDDQQSR